MAKKANKTKTIPYEKTAIVLATLSYVFNFNSSSLNST